MVGVANGFVEHLICFVLTALLAIYSQILINK